MCQCLPGFQLSPSRRSCVDVDECSGNPCGAGAVCVNTVGSFICQCPGGTTGDPSKKCDGASRRICSADGDCSSNSGETCVGGACVCRRGFIRGPDGACADLDECLQVNHVAKHVCGVNAVCKNLPGSYDCECPQGFSGNPFVGCRICQGEECGCAAPSTFVNGRCQTSGCSGDSDCASPAQCVQVRWMYRRKLFMFLESCYSFGA